MAAVLKLSKVGYGGVESNSLNLYANAAGFSIAGDGWIPKVMHQNDTMAEEVITLRVIGSSHNDLATKIQNMAAKLLEVVQDAEDISSQYNVWLVDQLTNETNARRAFIFDARIETGDSLHGPLTDPGNHIAECRLVLQRGHWEESALSSTGTLSGISTLGGDDNYATITGDIPARIDELEYRGEDGGGGPLYEFWTGFRTPRFGTVANFVPVWECEDGTNGTDASDDAVSEPNTASPGSGSGAYVEIDFSGDESLVTRFTVEVEDVTANYGDQGGTFAVLLRTKVGSNTTCRVRLLDGFSSASDWRTQSRVVVDAENWFMYALGTVTIPPARINYSISSYLSKYALRLQAERVSGSGSLLCDCFVLVPMSEGFVHVTGGATQYVAADDRPSIVKYFPNGDVTGVALTGGVPVCSLSVDMQRFGLPVGVGTLYLVAQRSTQQILSDTLTVVIDYGERWLMLRGSE